MDYAYPVPIGKDIVFGEFHGRFEDPLQLIRGNPQPNMQFLFGGGYRKRITKKSMVGVLGFYNTTRYYGQWYSSGIMGLEACVFTPGDGSIDASLYHYGNVFRGDTGIFAAFKHGAGDFKFEGAYSQPLFERRCVLRAKASHYVFNKLGNVRGYYVGADLSSSDGMFRLEYLTGHDALSGRYHKLGFYFTVGFRAEKLFSGENPFSKP